MPQPGLELEQESFSGHEADMGVGRQCLILQRLSCRRSISLARP
jgi:hypothetical protein